MTVARAVALTPRVAARAEVEAVTGWRLDRFSRYTVGTLDHVLRGYPGASLHYDRGAIARTMAGWVTTRGLRVDAFADVGVLRDPGFGPALRGYPGVGAAVEGAGPFRTLWSIDWGYGLRGVRSDGRQGTHVVRLSIYRVF